MAWGLASGPPHYSRLVCSLPPPGFAVHSPAQGGGESRMDANGGPRVVLVHDWLTGMRGGEKCLEVLCRHWPQAPLFTLLYRPGAVLPVIEQRPLYASWFQ